MEIRIGRQLSNGSVRYVVRPIEWLWVGMMAVAAVGMSIAVLTSGGTWYGLPIFAVLPLGVAWRSGFDLDPSQRTIRAWHALGFIPIGGFTIASADMPQVRTALETRTSNDDVESTAKITRLYWGSRNLRTTLPPEALRELLKEAKRVANS